MRYNLRSLFPVLSTALILIFLAALVQAGEGATGTTTSNGAAAVSAKGATTAKNDIVASVNGVAISQARFDSAMTPYRLQIAAMGEGAVTDEQMTEIKTKVLENLIGTELLYQECQKSNIKVEDKEVDATYNEQKTQFSTEDEFKQALKQYNFSDSAFKDQIKVGLTIQNLINTKFTLNTAISDEEVKKYYDDNPSYFQEPEKVRASHIMMMVGADEEQAKKDEAKKKIDQVLKRLKGGEDFAALAKEVSEDASTKDNGGDLDYFYKGQMVQAFEDAAFALKPGEISNVVETEYGYHIIKLTDKKDAKTITLDESKEEIRNGLKTNKVNSDVSKYVTELRTKSKVEIFLAQ